MPSNERDSPKIPGWGTSSFEFNRRQMGIDLERPWTIAVLREDEPLFLASPHGMTTFSSSYDTVRWLTWWVRIKTERRSQKAWLVVAFDRLPSSCTSIEDAVVVENYASFSEAAKRAAVVQANIEEIFRSGRSSREPGSGGSRK